MPMLDEVNDICIPYADELTNKWGFTGWKAGQGSIRLHAQWYRTIEYDGQSFATVIQCLPIELENEPTAHFIACGKQNMKTALDGVQLLDQF